MIIAELLASLGVAVDKDAAKKVDATLKGIATGATRVLGGVAAIFGGASFVGFVNELVQVGSVLSDTSAKLGVNTRVLQEWQFAAGQAGASAEAISNGFKFAAKNAYDAADGLKEPSEAFARLGVSVKDSNGALRTSEVIFEETLNALAGVENPAERTALALKTLGRGGSDLLPLIAEGADGIAALRARFQELGGGFSPEFVAQADTLGDSIDALKVAGQGLKSAFGLAIFPILQRAVDFLEDLTGWFNRVTKNTRFVKSALFVLSAAFVAWGVAALWAARQAIAGWLAAAAPFLLVAAAIGALTLVLDDLAALLTGGKSLVGQYLDEWLGVGTADALVRNWTAGVVVLTEAWDAAGVAIGDALLWIDENLGLVNVAVVALTGPFGLLAKFAIENLDLIGSKIRQFADWVIGIGETILNALDPTGALGGVVKNQFRALRDLLPDLPDFGALVPAAFRGPGPVNAADRVNRDGTPFFDFAASPGVAAPDAVHPALRPGTVTTESATSTATVTNNNNVTINAPPGSNARDIGRQVRRELDAREAAQAGRVRRALVNRPRGN